jgi:hypothetical protein
LANLVRASCGGFLIRYFAQAIHIARKWRVQGRLWSVPKQIRSAIDEDLAFGSARKCEVVEAQKILMY